MSSRPSSPRSEETKSSLPASPEVSLSPSRSGHQDSWWQLPRKAALAARVLSRSVSPNSWKAAASRAEQEGRAEAAAEIALLRMSSGIPMPQQARPTTAEAVNSEGKTVSATELALLSSISTSAGTGGSAQSSPRQRRADEGVPNLQRLERRGLLYGVPVQTEDALPAKRPLHSNSPRQREKNKWSPCKWPPSSRWPSSQLPRNVNQWPLAGDDKPAGLDTWTHILFTTGLRRSPSASPTRGHTKNPSATSSYKSRHSDRPNSARLARSARSASACDMRSFSQGSSPRTPRTPRSQSQSRKLHQSVSQSKLHKSLSDR